MIYTYINFPSSQHILHQLFHIILHMINPKFRIGLVYLFWYCCCLIEFFFVYFFLLLLFLGKNLILILLRLLRLHCNWLCWLLLWLWFLWLECWFGAMAKEVGVCTQNVLLLEHYLVCWVLLYLVSCQTPVCLLNVHCHQGAQYLLKLSRYVIKYNHTFLHSLRQQIIILNLLNQLTNIYHMSNIPFSFCWPLSCS